MPLIYHNLVQAVLQTHFILVCALVDMPKWIQFQQHITDMIGTTCQGTTQKGAGVQFFRPATTVTPQKTKTYTVTF